MESSSSVLIVEDEAIMAMLLERRTGIINGRDQ